MSETTQPVQPVPVPAGLAKVLLGNQSQINDWARILQVLPIQIDTVKQVDQKIVAALLEDAGLKLSDFDSWEYGADPEGGVTLVLHPKPPTASE